jgi:DNA-binding transcriptional MocR family regulator
VAFLAVPSRSIERIERAIWATLWMVSPLCAEVACTWIEDGSAELTVAKKRAEARARTDATRERFGGNLRCRPSGYHSWLQLPEQWQAPAFAEEARKRGVGVTPADAFFIGSGTPPHAVRISMSAARSLETLNIGLDRLAGLLEEAPGLGSPIV